MTRKSSRSRSIARSSSRKCASGDVLDAVVEVDVGRLPVQAPRHAQEGRDADATGDPDLAVVRQVAAREGPVRAFDDRLRPGLERAQGTRVVADRLDRDPQRPLVGGRGDRERVELVAQERRKLLAERLAEVDEEELPGLERERPLARLHHDLGDELVEPVHGRDAVLQPADEKVPEQRPVHPGRDPDRRERRHVDVQRRRVAERAVRREDVVGGAEEDDAERALHVDEELVPDADEERQDDRDDHPGEREHAREHRPPGSGPSRSSAVEVEMVARLARISDHVGEQEGERDLAVQAVHAVHALEPAEEPLHGPEARAEHEVERERRRCRRAHRRRRGWSACGSRRRSGCRAGPTPPRGRPGSRRGSRGRAGRAGRRAC